MPGVAKMLGFDAGWPGIGGGWWFSIFPTGTCMLGIQYLLLKTYRARKVLPSEVVPSQSELYAGVAVFWLAYLGSIKTLSHGVRGFLWVLSRVELISLPQFFSSTSFSLSMKEASNRESSETGLGFQLFDLVVLTWQIHQITLLLVDITVPSIKSLNTQPKTTLQNLCSRVHALVSFLQLITIGQASAHSSISLGLCTPSEDTSLSTTQKVALRRTQNSSPKKWRTLSWNLTIDKQALNEMKETLGPPGGFGELGFCVGKDEVRFEAMGVGTSFGLVFGVEDDEPEVKSKTAVRPEVKGKRRKTK